MKMSNCNWCNPEYPVIVKDAESVKYSDRD